MAANCTKSGKIKVNNFSTSEENALKSLKEKVETEKLTVYETDKTGKLVVDTLDNYESKMKMHTKNDKTLTHTQVQRIQGKLNRETQSWLNILKIGTNVGQAQRTKRNLVTKHSQIPILRGTSKDHKVAADSLVGPELRPIMEARIGPNTSLAQISCKILRAISDEVKAEHRFDVKSTEEMLNSFDTFNENLAQLSTSNKVLLSMDISKFYPSIVPEKAAEIAQIMWLKSTLEIENVDAEELAFILEKIVVKKKLIYKIFRK